MFLTVTTTLAGGPESAASMSPDQASRLQSSITRLTQGIGDHGVRTNAPCRRFGSDFVGFRKSASFGDARKAPDLEHRL